MGLFTIIGAIAAAGAVVKKVASDLIEKNNKEEEIEFEREAILDKQIQIENREKKLSQKEKELKNEEKQIEQNKKNLLTYGNERKLCSGERVELGGISSHNCEHCGALLRTRMLISLNKMEMIGYECEYCGAKYSK